MNVRIGYRFAIGRGNHLGHGRLTSRLHWLLASQEVSELALSNKGVASSFRLVSLPRPICACFLNLGKQIGRF